MRNEEHTVLISSGKSTQCGTGDELLRVERPEVASALDITGHGERKQVYFCLTGCVCVPNTEPKSEDSVAILVRYFFMFMPPRLLVLCSIGELYFPSHVGTDHDLDHPDPNLPF